jgi:hypothetical protein
LFFFHFLPSKRGEIGVRFTNGGVAALLTDAELAPPMYDDDAFLFLTLDEDERLHDVGQLLTLDEGGQLQDTERVGIATARETTVRDGNDLMRIYGQSL